MSADRAQNRWRRRGQCMAVCNALPELGIKSLTRQRPSAQRNGGGRSYVYAFRLSECAGDKNVRTCDDASQCLNCVCIDVSETILWCTFFYSCRTTQKKNTSEKSDCIHIIQAGGTGINYQRAWSEQSIEWLSSKHFPSSTILMDFRKKEEEYNQIFKAEYCKWL